MKRILTLLMAVCIAGTVFLFSSNLHSAHAASTGAGPHSTAIAADCGTKEVAKADRYNIYIKLYYDSCSGNNYGVIYSGYLGYYAGYIKLERAAGPDGGYYSAEAYCETYAYSTCSTLPVYSPNNAARVCWRNDEDDPGFCTVWF